ncbi:tRNA uridine 5-oxyacetic acid(34) methyltransferase CmoM [Erwinia sp. OLTSP20]|uniref:tRNA uridine 5-oxyacetic acid(34) methyltransferase CmoM n=1 Tax=unclassified Erwinia TaxID=2622719 RepID=UPI000C1948FF|nr:MULTISPECIES: tRNA uridine 5-oxyacetic acid(34) methyltransferase CmoM [unclassified Erwinia]PIJ51330.1 tRNA uridine 5-oxyacetic acid(34) methyltransferase CmoM [Erwinia sp. OAMSP11]PIJ74115.1 tRNA uridine 5-oxyacetic acid(34) methyltransferase CmoM [Erwinia sp. OLSSP12]PIJ79788.1 tRNA uridine 5-oxyacetic acid(34) methyltransferase CmoM [Erwinia sp. OLCASP19]PIJ86078.1 tRNA uridine 5-oxyacetic acid(34) methyltransferase CmoM [Erwinia sp. OLMTSP26]PIJ87827.1 tRNA uridine 5-oxyacetic acid(34)
MQDRNFDDIAEKFSQNIYGTTKGRVRQAILWQALERLLSTLPAAPLRVLDAGGGEGQTGCAMAQRGHNVMLCDLSEQMIARARQLAVQQGVSDNMQFKQIAVQNVAQHLDTPVDLVLFHAVLEWVAEPQAVLKSLFHCLKPGGVLSLMFYNINGLRMRNLVLGNFAYLQANMPKRKKRSLSPDYPREPEDVYRWLAECGFTLGEKTGIRVFHDYMRDKHLQTERFDELLALESHYCRQEPFLSLGRYIHVVARKPVQKDEL